MPFLVELLHKGIGIQLQKGGIIADKPLGIDFSRQAFILALLYALNVKGTNACALLYVLDGKILSFTLIAQLIP